MKRARHRSYLRDLRVVAGDTIDVFVCVTSNATRREAIQPGPAARQPERGVPFGFPRAIEVYPHTQPTMLQTLRARRCDMCPASRRRPLYR